MSPKQLQASNESARFRHAQRDSARRAREDQFNVMLAKSEAFFKSTTAPTPLPEVGRVVWSGRKDVR